MQKHALQTLGIEWRTGSQLTSLFKLLSMDIVLGHLRLEDMRTHWQSHIWPHITNFWPMLLLFLSIETSSRYEMWRIQVWKWSYLWFARLEGVYIMGLTWDVFSPLFIFLLSLFRSKSTIKIALYYEANIICVDWQLLLSASPPSPNGLKDLGFSFSYRSLDIIFYL